MLFENKKLIKEEKGQAFVEFALVLPVLLLILCGIIDFGWIFTHQNIVDHCAREGARYAIIHSTDVDAISIITDYTKSLAPANIGNSLDVDVTFSNTISPRLGDVTVQISGRIDVLTPLIGLYTKEQSIELNSSCTMRVE